MTAEELRIGNYIKEQIQGNVVQVASIIQVENGIFDIEVKDNDGMFCDIQEYIEPVPLTEQWLFDFGAIEYLGSSRTFKYSRFELLWREEYNYWYVTDFEDETYMTKIEFVHEFQNFIFAMDQEELKVKTTSSTSQ